MIFHSAFFMILNGLGQHLKTFRMDIIQEKMIAYTLATIAFLGLVMTTYIAYRVVCAMRDIIKVNQSRVKILDQLWELIVFTFLIATVFSHINFVV